MSFVVFLSPS